jgi:reductive dehalogenase
MDQDVLASSPSAFSNISVGLGYSKMAFIAGSLAQFIRNLGYNAIPCGNDTALSIPLAIDAGLGQLGRNGLLITPKYGPRVRIAKVLTDMPLKVEKPIQFGVTDVCNRCKKCAENCKTEAISFQDMTSKGPTSSNNSGVLKWYVDPEKCYMFWNQNGAPCSTCITVCPFNDGVGGEEY